MNVIPTRWCVFTGAPCSGKTTVIDELHKLGYAIKPEASRTYIEAELQKGRTLLEIRGDKQGYQQMLVRFKSALESTLPPDKLIFLDRALGDNVTYYRLVGLDPAEVIQLCSPRRYWQVFIFDRLPLIPDNVRTETEEEIAFLDREFELDYRRLGYNPIRVPVMPIPARVEFILKHIRAE